MLEYYPLISLPNRTIAAIIITKDNSNSTYVSANDSIYGTVSPEIITQPDNSNVINLFNKK
jgi:hypothetical protein